MRLQLSVSAPDSYASSTLPLVDRIKACSTVFHKLMVALGTVVVGATLSTGAYRLVLAEYRGINADPVFLAGYAVALTLPLIAVYAPIQNGLQATTRMFVETVIPLADRPQSWNESLSARKALEEHLAVDLRHRVGSGVAAVFVAPLLSAITVSMLSLALAG